MKNWLTLISLLFLTLSASAQIRRSQLVMQYENIANTLTFNFFDASALENQDKTIDLFTYGITDSISVTIRSPKVTETISSIPQANIAYTFTDFMADNLLIIIKADGYEDLMQMCALPKPIFAYDVFLRKKE